MLFKKRKVENSRRDKRFQADYLLKYRVQGSSEEPLISNIRDLSSGGLKFWSEQFLSEGTLLELDFLLPPLDREMDATGRIMRVRHAENSEIFYVAVRFVQIDEEDQKALADWIERLSKDRTARKLIYDKAKVKRQSAEPLYD